MNALLQLAERCEQAAEPDRETDGSIASLCLGAEVQTVSVGPDYRREEVCTIDRSSAAPVSRPVAKYTASLDAAMTLTAGTEEFGGPLGMLRWAMEMLERAEAPADALPRFICSAALKAHYASAETPKA